MRKTEYLTVAEVIVLHDRAISENGGLPGIRDYNALCSAVDAPKAALFGMEMYVTAEEKSAVYIYHLTKNHAFNDANKRTAFITAITFLNLNEIQPSFNADDLENLIVNVAAGNISKEQLTTFIVSGKLVTH